MLLFSGSVHNRKNTFNWDIYQYLYEQCEKSQLPITEIDLSEMEIPHFDPFGSNMPADVFDMLQLFKSEDKQIWLAPLYHGGIPGIMKNALDWLQLTSDDDIPYLTDKKIGLICVADGLFAMQGISAMNSIAHSLRAWVLPYTLPINKSESELRDSNQLAQHYQHKIELMVQLLENTNTKKIN